MKKKIRAVIYDNELRIEAYLFDGIMQPFPNHFHEHYAIGCIEDGQRILSCKNREYIIDKGSLVIFNPGDNHSCVQNDGRALAYRGFNISKDTMLNLAEEVTRKRELPKFSPNVIYDEELICYLRSLHEIIMSGISNLRKEESLLFLITGLIQKYGQPFEDCIPECRDEVEKVCSLLEQRYMEHICLEQLCKYSSLSKSTLLRAFTKSKGVTPYRYLENIRINKAKHLLCNGCSPLDAAMQTGFSDQSHFTNYFTSFTGLTPGAYRDIFCIRTEDGEQDEE